MKHGGKENEGPNKEGIMRLFNVHIRANVNTWRGYDYQTVQLFVFCFNASEIPDIVSKNAEAVYAYFDKKKYGRKRLVSYPIKKNLFIKNLGLIKPMSAQSYSVMALTNDGFQRIEV